MIPLSELALIGQIAMNASTAVLIAAIGEIITERSGILNLGVEGMMLMGALCGFAAGYATESASLACLCAMGAGAALASIHAFFSITLKANQVLSGLALSILGGGLSNFLGRPLLSETGVRLAPTPIPLLSDIPLLGEVFFKQNVLAYIAYLLVPTAWYVLSRTRLGLKIRAVGEDAAAADAMGAPVARIRYACVLVGGALAGLAGSYLSLAYTPGWKESMTAGQGWIAIALVIFATWNPVRSFFGALLFGLLTALQFYFQSSGAELLPAWFLRTLPYLLTIFVLVLVNRLERLKGALSAPADLGRPFSRE